MDDTIGSMRERSQGREQYSHTKMCTVLIHSASSPLCTAGLNLIEKARAHYTRRYAELAVPSARLSGATLDSVWIAVSVAAQRCLPTIPGGIS